MFVGSFGGSPSFELEGLGVRRSKSTPYPGPKAANQLVLKGPKIAGST